MTQNDHLIEMFQQMPANILIDEFLKQPLSEALKTRFTYYQQSLNKEILARTIIPDIMAIIEAEAKPLQEKQDKQDKQEQDTSAFDKSHFKNIVYPLLQLFSEIEKNFEQKETLQQMQSRAHEMSDINELFEFVEDSSDLIHSYLSNSAGAFEALLLQLQQRLNNVNTHISLQSETTDAIATCSDHLSLSVTNQVTSIQSSIVNTSALTNLESSISQNIESIFDSINTFDSERKVLQLQTDKNVTELSQELLESNNEINLLKKELEKQKERALKDPLTKLPNRHAYKDRIQLEYSRWQRYKNPLCLVMGDIDLFKGINDTYGHLAGDIALQITANELLNGVRNTDFVARFGGEEFIILLPETSLMNAIKTINKVRLKIQNKSIKEGSAEFKLTMSFGVAMFETDDTFNSVMKRADQAVYLAKSKGRNQVCIQRKVNA